MMFRTRSLPSVFLPSVLSLTLWLVPTPTSAADPLPGTKALAEEGDLARKMVDGMHADLDRRLAASPKEREKLWKIDTSSPEAYSKSVAPHRQRLRKYLGVVDERVPPRVEYVAGPNEPVVIAEHEGCRVFAVRWAVLPGVDAEGLLIEPHERPLACAVAIPHADQTPETITFGESQFAMDLARHGCRVLVPTLIDRKDDFSGNPKLGRATNLPHREFVHRMAYEMGRTLPGYEVQKVLAAVDWFASSGDKLPVGVIGFGDGGMIALYAAALDERIGVCEVAGYFTRREGIADEPIDHNVWGLLTEFGNAELAAMVGPPPIEKGFRRLVLDPGPATKFDPKFFPTWNGPAAPKPGRGGGAAPGTLKAPSPDAVHAEAERWYSLCGFQPQWAQKEKSGTRVETHEFLRHLIGKGDAEKMERAAREPARRVDPVARQKRQFDQLVAFTQRLWRESEATRKAFWAKADAKSPEAWEKSCEWYRDYFHSEVIGKLPDPTVPPNVRTRQVYDEPKWTGYEVVIDVYPDVIASGILLLPKDLKPGEKRSVVVCQHGLEGRPKHTIEPEKQPIYAEFSKQLAERGYIVYAPQNPYIFENHFRQLQRKANPLKLALYSYIIRQHQRTIDWLETLPNADPKRIAFYGLSYGGKTAMRVPAVEKRYVLSICSGDFNEWVGKNVSVDLDRSYMWTREYEMYEFDLGNTFNYAEMAYLIAPRPFMVERGHDDGVGTDEMVSYEFARVRYLYANRLKLADRTEIEYRVGGHRIFGEGTYHFLQKHLGYPPNPR